MESAIPGLVPPTITLRAEDAVPPIMAAPVDRVKIPSNRLAMANDPVTSVPT